MNLKLSNTKNKKGATKHLSSSLSDSHIKDVVRYLEKVEGISEAEILKAIDVEVKKYEDIFNKSPLLYDTIRLNLIESTVYDMCAKHSKDVVGPEFKKHVFNRLVAMIQAEHTEMFPLRGYINHIPLHYPAFDFVGEGHQITTAAATSKGQFIFNTVFCQSLLNYANITKVKPQGAKYTSNGGTIPDEYCYLEFLILHEFMHYTREDFHYGKVIPNADQKIINWVGDFRNNYILVKSGFSQLPMGLYNDNINEDRQQTYKEMYDLVKDEMDKLTPPEQKMMQELMDKLSDDHQPDEGSDGEGTDPSDIDKHAKNTSKQVKDSKDSKESSLNQGKERSADPGRGNTTQTQSINSDDVKPTMNWKQLISKMVNTASEEIDTSYMKPNRRNVSNMHIAKQTGSAALKPGEKILDQEKIKMCLAVDSSGSMSTTLGIVYSNVKALMKQRALQNATHTVVQWSDIFRIIQIKGNKAGIISKPGEDVKNMTLDAAEVYGETYGGGTQFDVVYSTLSEFAAKQYNVLVVTDSDILSGSNLDALSKLIKAHRSNVFVILDSASTYASFMKNGGANTKYVTHF